MSDLTDAGQAVIRDIAGRYGLPLHAVEAMARAVASGGGTMAQFNVPELGGSGQWMAGGMTMVGDMFNMGLQATVSNLCGELSNAMAQQALFRAPQTIAGSAWWPQDLGSPSSVGGQNSTRYAYFPQARRIAFDPGTGGPVVLLDTLDHQIGGFSQQQSGPGDPYMGITFSSQFGQFALSSLPNLSAPHPAPQPAPHFDPAPAQPAFQDPPAFAPDPGFADQGAPADMPVPDTTSAILDTIGKLAALREAGALTDDEFAAKKAELLARL